jgi:hypothetical protein
MKPLLTYGHGEKKASQNCGADAEHVGAEQRERHGCASKGIRNQFRLRRRAFEARGRVIFQDFVPQGVVEAVGVERVQCVSKNKNHVKKITPEI